MSMRNLLFLSHSMIASILGEFFTFEIMVNVDSARCLSILSAKTKQRRVRIKIITYHLFVGIVRTRIGCFFFFFWLMKFYTLNKTYFRKDLNRLRSPSGFFWISYLLYYALVNKTGGRAIGHRRTRTNNKASRDRLLEPRTRSQNKTARAKCADRHGYRHCRSGGKPRELVF